jgi:methionyl-tRNA formyltransferase
MYSSVLEKYRKIKIVFFCISKGIKSTIVLEKLTQSIPNENILIISDFDYQKSIINSNNFSNFFIFSRGVEKELIFTIKKFNADVIISCGWHKKISSSILDLAKYGAINCHSSYLPDYKGASVFKHYWSNLESFSGATIHYMTNNFDEGNIISQAKLKIFKRDTPYTILYKTSELTSILLQEALMLVLTGYKGKEQKGGRYFFKMSNMSHIVHFVFNRLLSMFGMKPRISRFKVCK